MEQLWEQLPAAKHLAASKSRSPFILLTVPSIITLPLAHDVLYAWCLQTGVLPSTCSLLLRSASRRVQRMSTNTASCRSNP